MNSKITNILYFPITKILLGIALCFSIFVLVQNFVSKPLLYGLIKNKNIADPLIHAISIITLLGSYYCFFRLYDKREIKELSLKLIRKELLGGFLLGFLAITISIFIWHILGYYKILSISTENYSLRLFMVLMVAALIEDLFHRGLILRELENWLGTHIAIGVVMLIEIWHVFNPNVTLFSFFFYLCWGFTTSMLFVYTKRVWLPYFFHLGWNFSQPFYGSNLTGVDDLGRIIHAKFEGPVMLTGGAMGIEDSAITLILLLSIGIYTYYRSNKEGKIIKRKSHRG